MIFNNVAAEAMTAIMMTFLLSSDEFCFLWIFEQSAFAGIKIMFVLDLFVVAFLYVGGTGFATTVIVVFIVVVDMLGIAVVVTNLVTGS